MSDKIDKEGIVRSVLYAVVVSAWASVVSNNSESVLVFIQWLGNFLKPLCESGNHCAAFMSIGVFAFLTIYFHDEWAYCSEEGLKYPKEKPSIQCAGWSFFLFQVCLLGTSLIASSICGIIGVAIISGGFFRSLGFRETLRNRFFWENAVWIGAMIIFLLVDLCGIGRTWAVWLLLLPVAFPLMRFICHMAYRVVDT